MEYPEHIFLAGAPQNKVASLASLLNSIPEILVFPEEISLFDHVIPGAQYRNLASLSDYVLTETSVSRLLYRPNELFDPVAFERRFREMPLSGRNVHERLLRNLFDAYARASGLPDITQYRYVVECSHTNDTTARRLIHSFPQALFFHLIQDPRALYVQMLGNNNRTRPQQFAYSFVHAWNRSVHARRFFADHSERYQRIRSEDLAEQPKHTLRRLCDYLDFDCPSLSKQPFPGIERATRHWRQQLDAHELWWIEHHCRAGMLDCGYEPVTQPSSLPHAVIEWLRPLRTENATGYLDARGGSLTYHLAPGWSLRRN